MSTQSSASVITGAPAAEYPHPTDRTDNRIRAFLAAVRPRRDSCFREDIEQANHRGRSFIERLALSAEGTDLPRLRLTASQVADVLSFIACTDPVEPASWWHEPDDEASHLVGHYLLLHALEASLRAASGSTAPGLTEKCARAKALMEEAQRLVDEVLEDPEYRDGVLPRGVVPEGVGDYLDYAINSLEEEPIPHPGDDDYVAPGSVAGQEPQPA